MKQNNMSWKIKSSLPMTEEEIIENAQFVDWNEISRCQKLSEPFILNNASRLNMNFITLTQDLSDSTLFVLKDRITLQMINNVCRKRQGLTSSTLRMSFLENIQLKKACHKLQRKLKVECSRFDWIAKLSIGAAVLLWLAYLGAQGSIGTTANTAWLVINIIISVVGFGFMLWNRAKKQR